jgi:hypothetical protein
MRTSLHGILLHNVQFLSLCWEKPGLEPQAISLSHRSFSHLAPLGLVSRERLELHLSSIPLPRCSGVLGHPGPNSSSFSSNRIFRAVMCHRNLNRGAMLSNRDRGMILSPKTFHSQLRASNPKAMVSPAVIS